MSQLQTRHSGFWRWLIALSVACLVVFFADIFPAIRLLDFVAILTTFVVCVLSFALIFTDVRTALLGLTAAAVCFSISYNHWPATTRFKFSEGRLSELLADYQALGAVDAPVWCGSYYIEKIGRRGESVCFWTDLTPAGYTGLIYTPDGQRMKYLNVHKQIHLNSNWQIVSED